MHFSNTFPTSDLEKDLQFIRAGLVKGSDWVDAAILMANYSHEYTYVLEEAVLALYPVHEHKTIRVRFQILRNGAVVARLFAKPSKRSKSQKKNPHPNPTSATLASSIADSPQVREGTHTRIHNPHHVHNSQTDAKVQPTTPVEERPQQNIIAVDPELARLASALKQAPQFRLWVVLLQRVRDSNALRISRADLEADLPKYGINVSTRNLRRWLHRGHGLFWNVTDEFIYFIGYEKVAHGLVKIALEQNLPDLVNTNRPGKRGMYLDVVGSLQQFEANIYAAWLAYREDPTIARSTLAALFNRQPRILRQWDTLANVKVITNEAQFAPDHFADVPEHAYMYQASIGQGHSETRFRARMVNTYHTPSIKQHGKRGQSRRVFHKLGQYLESLEPAGNCEQGSGSDAATGGLKPTGRRYFASREKARSSAKHTGKRIRYIALRMDKHKRMIWDYASDGVQRTTVGEELPLKTQKRFTPKAVYARDVIYG